MKDDKSKSSRRELDPDELRQIREAVGDYRERLSEAKWALEAALCRELDLFAAKTGVAVQSVGVRHLDISTGGERPGTRMSTHVTVELRDLVG